MMNATAPKYLKRKHILRSLENRSFSNTKSEMLSLQKSEKTVHLYRVACYFVLNNAQFGEMHFQKGIEDN